MRSLATGREQTVADLGGRVQWAPDGRRVLVSALICSSKQTLALRVVNVGTGRSTYLARIGPAWSLAFKTAIARWAPGGPSRGSIALLVAAVGG